MKNESLIALSVLLSMAGVAAADDDGKKGRCGGFETGPYAFTPIAQSANSSSWDPGAPWIIPEGFAQYGVSDETDLNIYDGGRDDWDDMNTVNETGKQAGRYLYRTHEVRDVPEGGAVSVVDLETGAAKVIAQDKSWSAIDGIEWTPWGTILFAEERTDGRLFELVLDKKDLTKGQVYERSAVGLLAHEGIAADRDGSVYVIDEHRGVSQGCGDTKPCGGSIYRFVPKRRGDLSEGALYVLKVDGGVEGTGQGQWVGPIDPLQARTESSRVGGTSYQRPEDLEIIGKVLYVAITEGTPNADGDENYDGRVLAVNLQTLKVTDYVRPGLNVPVEIGVPGDANHQTGFDNPDNLAQTPDGKLVIVEDNVPSDIWIVSGDCDGDGTGDSVGLFASLTDPEAEGTGIYFGKDPDTMFVNVQHSKADDGDGTWAIVKQHSEHDHEEDSGGERSKRDR